MNNSQRAAAERLADAIDINRKKPLDNLTLQTTASFLRELVAADVAENATTDAENATTEPVQEPDPVIRRESRGWSAADESMKDEV